MGDKYAEVLIKKKTDNVALICRLVLVLVTIFIAAMSIMYVPSVSVLVIALFIYLTYIVFKNTDVEFEYSFVNGQLDIECIYGKKKRKPAKSFNFDKLEVLAPEKHQKVLAYEKRQGIKNFNYSSGYEDRDIYIAILVGKDGSLGRLIFEPSEEMIKTIYSHTPSKVFKTVE